MPIIDTEYSFEGVVDSTIIFNDSISNVIQIEFEGAIPQDTTEVLGIPNNVFKMKMPALPDVSLDMSSDPITIPMPDKIEQTISFNLSELIDFSSLESTFGCLPISNPLENDKPLLETISNVLPDTSLSFGPTIPDLGMQMFSVNSGVFSKGEWKFGINNKLFFDIDTAKVNVVSGTNQLYIADLGRVVSNTNMVDTHVISESDMSSWNTISFQQGDSFLVAIDLGIDSSQDGDMACLWNEDAPPFYMCDNIKNPVSTPSDLEVPSLYQDDSCNGDCGIGTCKPVFFCDGHGYFDSSSCENYEYIGDFSAFDFTQLDSFVSTFSPNLPIYTFSDALNPSGTKFYALDGTCANCDGSGYDSSTGQCSDGTKSCTLNGLYGSERSCSASCVQGNKIANSGWDISGADFSLDIEFSNLYEKLNQINISTTGWDTTISQSSEFPSFEGMGIKKAKLDTSTASIPNKLLLNIINGLFADFILSFNFLNFFNEETKESLSKEFIIPANDTLDSNIDFSEYVLSEGINSEEILSSMSFNITAGFASGDYAVYADNNTITIGGPEFETLSFAGDSLSLQYIEAITDTMNFDSIKSPPITGIPDGFSGFEFYDIIMEYDFINQIGIPVELNLDVIGTKEDEEKIFSLNIPIGAPYSNLYGCDFAAVGDTARTFIRFDKDGQRVEYYCGPKELEPSCICPGGDCCSETNSESTTIVDFMNFAPSSIELGGNVQINGQGILAPNTNISANFKLIAPFSFVFKKPINIIPAQATEMAPMDAESVEGIDSSLVEASLNVNLINSSPLGGSLSLLISDNNIFPLFIDSLITGKWNEQLKPTIWSTLWDTLDPAISIDSIACIQTNLTECSLSDSIPTLEVKFYNDQSKMEFFIGRLFELRFPRSDSIEYNLGYVNPDFPKETLSSLTIDKKRMDWIISDEQRYNIAMITFDSSPLIEDTTFVPLTFQTSNYIGVQTYLTLVLNTGGF